MNNALEEKGLTFAIFGIALRRYRWEISPNKSDDYPSPKQTKKRFSLTSCHRISGRPTRQARNPQLTPPTHTGVGAYPPGDQARKTIESA